MLNSSDKVTAHFLFVILVEVTSTKVTLFFLNVETFNLVLTNRDSGSEIFKCDYSSDS